MCPRCRWPRCRWPPSIDRTSISRAKPPSARKVTTMPLISGGASGAGGGGRGAPDGPEIESRTPVHAPWPLAEDGGMDWASVPSPIGPLGVAADEQGIRFVRFDGPAGPLSTNPHLSLAAEQLAAYFAGSRTGFALPLAPAGGTPFERAVWRAIADIPYGETDTYGRIA